MDMLARMDGQLTGLQRERSRLEEAAAVLRAGAPAAEGEPAGGSSADTVEASRLRQELQQERVRRQQVSCGGPVTVASRMEHTWPAGLARAWVRHWLVDWIKACALACLLGWEKELRRHFCSLQAEADFHNLVQSWESMQTPSEQSPAPSGASHAAAPGFSSAQAGTGGSSARRDPTAAVGHLQVRLCC